MKKSLYDALQVVGIFMIVLGVASFYLFDRYYTYRDETGEGLNFDNIAAKLSYLTDPGYIIMILGHVLIFVIAYVLITAKSRWSASDN